MRECVFTPPMRADFRCGLRTDCHAWKVVEMLAHGSPLEPPENADRRYRLQFSAENWSAPEVKLLVRWPYRAAKS